ncbi:hypothetical protein ACJX0J_023127, partial [Zea mays]
YFYVIDFYDFPTRKKLNSALVEREGLYKKPTPTYLELKGFCTEINTSTWSGGVS